VWVQKAEMLGRGDGEGALILTTHRIIHWKDYDIGILLPSVERVSVRRIVIPGQREVTVSVSSSNGTQHASFYVPKRLAEILERLGVRRPKHRAV
jgi:hypothetical protein